MDTPVNKAVIELRDVSYRYPGAEAPVLEKVCLSVGRGEFVVVAGPTGSGKSTLGLVLAGIIPEKLGGECEGEIRIAGRRGILFQNPDSQLFSLTVGDDIAFGPRNFCCGEEDVALPVREAARVTGVEALMGLSPNVISTGEKQRAALASVLSMRPDLLVLDEPTAFLDPAGKEAVMELLRQLSIGGTTIVMMEHNLRLARMFGCRIVNLMAGCVVEDGDDGDLPDELGLCEGEFLNNVERKRRSPGKRKAVEISSLCFRYPGGREALGKIDLSIDEGEFVGILGPNGSGKTTLAKHMNGLLSPYSGKITVFGKKPEPAVVGYGFQDPDYQLFESTVAREVAFGPGNLRLEKKEIQNRVRFAAEATDLLDVLEADPHMLSAGQKRLVGIATVLAMNTPVIVLDEPSAGLDLKRAARIMEVLTRLNDEGRTVIVLSHNVDLAARFCTRVIVMNRGGVVYDGAPELKEWHAYIR